MSWKTANMRKAKKKKLMFRYKRRNGGKMTLEIFLFGLLVVSVLTGLFTEAIKKWLQERDKHYYPNALAGYVAVGLSIAVGIAYVIVTGAAINAQMAVYLIALVLLSWLCAMVGYDKVIQAISQFKTYKKEE